MESFAQDELGNALPWMTYPFIEFIAEKLRQDYEIFEFGLGASTLFFASHVKKVTVVENDAKWCEIMKIKIAQLGLKNIEIILLSSIFDSSIYENSLRNLEKKFDLIIVDSRKRFECVKNSYEFIKDGGALILDDSQREGYKKIFEFMHEKNFQQQDFIGIAPGQVKLKMTTMFTR